MHQPAIWAGVRPALAELVPYEPGKPTDEVQRELGLARVVKLASNEGPFPPFEAALRALERGARELNRYPDGGVYRLRAALADHHGVDFDQVVVGGGADGVIAYLSIALLDPGDEIVCGWPSFPSYVIDAVRQGATPVRVPLVDHRYDLDSLLAAIGDRTKIVYVCNPNNPTGTMVGRDALDRFLDAVPPHALVVLDEAYYEYVDEQDYPDGVEDHVKRGRAVLALRTFSKIYGLAGLRVGYGVGPASVVGAIRKVQNAFDVTQPAQDAARASLGDPSEVARRRTVNRDGRARLVAGLEALGLSPVGPAVANFVYVDVGSDATVLFDRLLREGVIVRPMRAFGAPTAIRVSVGTEEEVEIALGALGRVL